MSSCGIVNIKIDIGGWWCTTCEGNLVGLPFRKILIDDHFRARFLHNFRNDASLCSDNYSNLFWFEVFLHRYGHAVTAVNVEVRLSHEIHITSLIISLYDKIKYLSTPRRMV